MVPGQFAEEDKIAELTLIKITQNHASVLRVVSRQFCGYIISMDLTNISEVKNILKTHRLWAKKRLGQHFLISKSVLKKIIQSSDLKKSDVVLEIGAGLGVLTLELLNKVKKVIAVEKDPLMAKILEENAKNFKNLKILNQDILKLDLQKEIPEKYKVVANIPYYITSPILKNFLEAENKPEFLILMVQKEMAQRIVAKPGEMSILAVSVQFYAKPGIISYVSKDSFWPKPEVDSAIIKLTVNPPTSLGAGSKQLTVKNIDEKGFFRIVRVGFSSPRKQLHNNIASGFKLTRAKAEELLLKAGIVPQKRAEDLSLKDWINLYNIFYTK